MEMRWFTRDWATGGLSDAEWERRSREYAQHLNSIQARLVGGAELLISEVDIHDAQVRSFRVDERALTVALSLLVGDLQVGYEWVDLLYGHATPVEDRARVTEWLLDPDTELLYDELDVVAGGFEHRVLLAPAGEFGVRFAALAVEHRRASASDRR